MTGIPSEGDADLGGVGPVRRLSMRLWALSRHSFAQDGAWVVATQVVGKGTATLLMIGLARWLSVSDFAAFGYLFATAALLSSYLAAGLPLVVSRATAEGRDGRTWGDDPRLGAVLVIALATGILAATLSSLYLPLLVLEDRPVSGPLLIAAALAMTWTALAQAGMYGSGYFRVAFSPVVVGTLLMLAVTGVAIWQGSLTLLIVGNIAGIVFPAIAYTRRLHREGVLSAAHWSKWPSRAAIRNVMAITLPGLGFSIIYASMNWLLIRGLIEQQASPDQFNQYVIGLQWFSLALFVPLAFGQVLFPKFIQKAQKGQLTTWQIVTPIALTFGLVLACAMVGVLLTPLLSILYGDQYEFGRDFVFMILLAAALSGAVNMLGSFVMAAKGMLAWLLINLASAVMAVLYLWLFPLETAFAAARTLCLIQLTPIAVATFLVFRYRAGSRTS